MNSFYNKILWALKLGILIHTSKYYLQYVQSCMVGATWRIRWQVNFYISVPVHNEPHGSDRITWQTIEQENYYKSLLAVTSLQTTQCYCSYMDRHYIYTISPTVACPLSYRFFLAATYSSEWCALVRNNGGRNNIHFKFPFHKIELAMYNNPNFTLNTANLSQVRLIANRRHDPFLFDPLSQSVNVIPTLQRRTKHMKP